MALGAPHGGRRLRLKRRKARPIAGPRFTPISSKRHMTRFIKVEGGWINLDLVARITQPEKESWDVDDICILYAKDGAELGHSRWVDVQRTVPEWG